MQPGAEGGYSGYSGYSGCSGYAMGPNATGLGRCLCRQRLRLRLGRRRRAIRDVREQLCAPHHRRDQPHRGERRLPSQQRVSGWFGGAQSSCSGQGATYSGYSGKGSCGVQHWQASVLRSIVH